MRNKTYFMSALLCLGLASKAGAADLAVAFGARESVTHLALSPDGESIAYVTPTSGQGAALVTMSLAPGAKPKAALAVSGAPDRLEHCDWVSNQRLVCMLYGVVKGAITTLELLPMTRLIAVDADGGNVRLLGTRSNPYTRGLQLGGGSVIDWLPDEKGAVLMTRHFLPDDHVGSHLGSVLEGLGVDRMDTASLTSTRVEAPKPTAVHYLSDGHGTVRIMGMQSHRGDQQDSGIVNYSYRLAGSRDWLPFGRFNSVDLSGFEPAAIDADLNLVYGFKKKDGRMAVYSISLDDKLSEQLVYARPDVDVDQLIRIGRRQRVVGVSYATDVRNAVYFDPAVEKLMVSLLKAVPNQTRLRIADASVDENKLLVFADSDNDPGVYYIFDRKQRQLNTFLVARTQLEGMTLARVKSVSYPAPDGQMIPGYLTLPPGKETAKGLPAIVLPHGGPSARDEWGFDWLSQYFAARGFAVLQPNFRGSSGYGDAWFQQNGFRSWPVAIGDILAAGNWLVKEGIADPAKLGIVGWSYGGYAALQSAVVDPAVFKAVVAIAPVTDLAAIKEEHRNWSDFDLVSQFVGDGPHVREGSPAAQAKKIKVPVMLFHGALDSNVGIAQSKLMAERLKDAGVHCELVTWDGLDHYLDDSAARADMLRKADAFLRQVMAF